MKFHGTSLIEVSVVIGITAMVTLGAASFIILSFRNQRIINDQLFGQKEARRIVSEIVNTVRTAEPSSVGSYAIAEATTSSLAIYANIDADSLRERIHYWLEGTDLKKGVLKPTGNPLSYTGAEQVSTLVHNVQNLSEGMNTFEYFTESYAGTGTSMASPVIIPSIRMVKIAIEIERDQNVSPVPLRVEALTQIRNLKEN